MIAPELLDLMDDTVTLYRPASHDRYGNQTWGAGTALQARVVYEPREVRNDAGDIVVSSATAWVGSTPGIRPSDRLVLPDGIERSILHVSRYPDEDGPHHEKVYLG